MNGLFVFVLAFTVLGAVVLIPRAIEHDRLWLELENLDDEALAEAMERMGR